MTFRWLFLFVGVGCVIHGMILTLENILALQLTATPAPVGVPLLLVAIGMLMVERGTTI